MDEQERAGLTLDAPELIAADLERLRLLREYELGVQVAEDGGDPYVRPVEER